MLSINLNNKDCLYRGYALACAYLLDYDNDLNKITMLLEYLFDTSMSLNIHVTTVSLITHLYGIALKLNLRTKGEGLALIEQSRLMKNKIPNIERTYYLITENFDFTIDYDEESLNYIKNNLV